MRRSLVTANIVLLAILVSHDLDHVRQGRSLGMPVVMVGLVGLISAVVCLALTLRSHRWAPHASLLIGVGNVIGFVAVHILPKWSPLSDPYPAVGVDAISWMNVGVAMLAAALLALAGGRAIRSS